MVRTTPRVEGDNLYLLSQDHTNSATIPLGSEQWYGWLESHQTFRMKGDAVTYTARKERRAGLWYWYAYRRSTGKLRIAYLGKSGELTAERLNSVAQVFALPPPHPARVKNSAHASSATSETSEQISLPESPGLAHSRVRGNLPVERTSFVGRTYQLEEAMRLLEYSRLLTLTGVGGIGKTRLALHLASTLSERFPGGCWFVDLARISASADLLPALALVLGIQPKREQDLLASIQVAFQRESVLLIFDNCEHLLDVCAPLIGQLLNTSPSLHILATSREMLCLPGEIILSVPPLSLPKPSELFLSPLASQSEAVQLLVERIIPLHSSFVLTEQNMLAVAHVCQQLEGIPLALELVAARLRLMPVEQIAQRLDQELGARFHLLTAGKRTTATRHQTLRATLDWSYQLLSFTEQRLLCRLSIFAGGWTLEAAEAVCAGENIAQVDILDLLGKLVHKSLMQVHEEAVPVSTGEAGKMYRQARYRLLEMIREYSREKLQQAGEEQILQRRHLAYFLQIAQQADTKLRGPQQLYWLVCLDNEHDNLQAALRSARQTDHDAALRLTTSLAFYWMIRSQFLQGRKELEETLAMVGDCADSHQADCLSRGSLLTFFQGDMPRSRQLAETSLALFWKLEDRQGIGPALCMQIEATRQMNAAQQALALCEEYKALLVASGDDWNQAFMTLPLTTIYMHQGHGTQALSLLEESLHLMRKQGDRWGISMLCSNLGKLHGHLGHYAEAIAHFEESASLAREIGDNNGVATGEHALAIVCLHRQDYIGAQEQLAKARKGYEQSGNLAGLAEILFDQGYAASLDGNLALAVRSFEHASTLYSTQRNQVRISLIRYHLGRIAVRQYDIPRALSLLCESCSTFHQNNQRIFLAGCLEALAALSIQLHSPQQGACWLGQARSLYAPTPQQRSLIPAQNALYEATVATLQTLLTGETFATEFARGEALPLEQVMCEIQALSLLKAGPSSSTSVEISYEHPLPIGLTTREIEVLRLLAVGLSNREIAANLHVSQGTIRTHLSAIYSKLAVHSRTAAIHSAKVRGVL